MRRTWMLLWIFGLAGGCGAPGNGVSGEDCGDGALGCMCYGNGTCDSGLVCVGTICEAHPNGQPPGPPGTGSSNPPEQPPPGEPPPEQPPPEPACELLPATFTQSTTIPKGCYLVAAAPSMGKYDTLTLSPGVTLKFAAGAALRLGESQTLRAIGTAADPIVFTGESATPGSWIGIEALSSAVKLELEHAIIEYAGAPATTVALGPAALKLEGTESASLRNVTIRHSGSRGFEFYLYYSAVIIRDSVVTGNATEPGKLIGPGKYLTGLFDSSSTFQGNGKDCIVNNLYDPPALPTLDVPFCP